MQVTLKRTDILHNLDLVSKVSTKHVTLPVLQCVLLKAEENSVTLVATNLEIGIEISMAVKCQEVGMVAVPASTLLQTIQYMSQSEITLRTEDTVLVVEAKGSETHIKTIPHEEFPTIPKIETKGQIINCKLFALGVKTAAFAASQSSIKPELGSVYVYQKKEHSLTFVTTDSFRLVEKTVPQKNFILNESVLIPYKNALELARVCDGVNTDPEFKINENQCALYFSNGVYVTSRLTSGSFPDYEQIIPKEYSSHVTVLKNDFTHALKKTNIFLNKFMQVSVHVTEASCTVSAYNNEDGTTTESITATTEGEDIQLNFNQRYLVDPLSHINDESIVMHFAGIGRPMVLQGVHDSTLRYLVMPMNK